MDPDRKYPRAIDPTLIRLVEELCREFEQRWRSGVRPLLAEYLQRVDSSLHGELLRELIALDVDYRQKLGEPVTLDEYRQQFPEYVNQLEAAWRSIARHQTSDTQSDLASTQSRTADHEGVCESSWAAIPAADGASSQTLTMGRYEVWQRLGEGAFGVVYLAHDPKLQRLVALKVPSHKWLDSPHRRECHLQEARAAAQLKHPGLVSVYDVQEEEARFFIVQEYIDGPHLGAWCQTAQPTSRQIVERMIEIAEAIGYAHQRNLVHRDLKPQNILVDSEGHAHVADFGLALDERVQRLRQGEVAGTAPYMSPEQVRGETHRLDGRSDLWSLGVILYELLTGRRPFAGSSWPEISSEITDRDPKPLRMLRPEISAELERIVLRCLAKRTTERYGSAAELVEDLRRWLADRSESDAVTPHAATGRRAEAGARQGAVSRIRSDLDGAVWDFAPLLGDKCRGFCGRDWFFREIFDWSHEAVSERTLLITGEPGVGKSSIVAEFVRQYGRTCVLAHHFCQADIPATLEPWRFVRSVAGMIARASSEYAAQLEDESIEATLSAASCRDDPVLAFERGILAPLHNVTPPSSDFPVQFLLIDALDESLVYQGAVSLIGLLAPRLEKLPAWLRLVITARKDPRVLDELQAIRAQELPIHDARNLDDLARYVDVRLEELQSQRASQIHHVDSRQIARILNHKSEGNFLYLRNAFDAVERGLIPLQQLDMLPPGLSSLYRSFFQRDFANEQQWEQPRRLLEVILAAKEPLDEKQLAEASHLSAHRDLPDVLERLAVYLRTSRSLQGNTHFAVFHKSLADWLTDDRRRSKLHYVRVTSGESALADVGWREFGSNASRMSRYALAHLPAHLIACERWTDVERLLADFGYLQAKVNSGLVFELAADYVLYEQAAPAQREMSAILARVGEAILRDVHFIAEHPEVFFQSLWNSCWWYDAPDAQQHYEPLDDMADAPWDRAGPKLFGLLETWRSWKKRQDGRFSWFRSLRPPPVHLGTSQRIVMRGHERSCRCLAFSPDGRRIASGSADGTVRIWDPQTGRSLQVVSRHKGIVASIGYSADGRRSVSAGFDNRVIAWDAPSWRALVRLEFNGGTIAALLDAGDREQVVDSQPASDVDVRCAAISPDGTRLCVGLRDGRLILWDDESRRLRLISGHSSHVLCVVFTIDGKCVYSAHQNGRVGKWDFVSGREQGLFRAHDGWVMQIAVAPNGHTLISGGDDLVRLWDLDSHQLLRTLTGHVDTVRSVASSPDGLRVASASHDGTVRLWDALTGQPTRCLRGHEGYVSGVAFGPHASRIVTAGQDRTIRVWDITQGEDLRSLRYACPSTICCGTVSTDNQHIVIGLSRINSSQETLPSTHQPGALLLDMAVSADEKQVSLGHPPIGTESQEALPQDQASEAAIELWDVTTGHRLRSFAGHTDRVNSVSLSPNGQYLASGSDDGSIRIWEINSGRELARFAKDSQPVASVEFSVEGDRVLSFQRRRACIWSVSSRQCLVRINSDNPVSWFFPSTLNDRFLVNSAESGTVRVWDVASRRVHSYLQGHERFVSTLAISPDERWIVTGSDDSTVGLWRSDTSEPVRFCQGHQQAVTHVTFAPTGTRFGSASKDHTLRLWDMNCSDSFALTGHTDWATCLAFSLDGTLIGSGSRDKTIRIWDAATGKELCRLMYHVAHITDVVFSSDGSMLASASRDQRICIWDLSSIGRAVPDRSDSLPIVCDTPLHYFRGHRGWVNSVAFNCDHSRVISGSDDATLRIWDCRTGSALNRLVGTVNISSMAVSPDNRFVSTCSKYGEFQRWDIAAETVCQAWPLPPSLERICFTEDGQYVLGLSGQEIIRVWDAASGQALVEHEYIGDRASPCALTIPRQPFEACQTSSGTSCRRLSGETVAWLPPGYTHIACGNTGRLWLGRSGSHLYLYALETDCAHEV